MGRTGHKGRQDVENDKIIYENIVRLIESGLSSEQVARKLKIGKERMWTLLMLYGETTVAELQKEIRERKLEQLGPEVLRLIEDGHNKQAILRMLNMTELMLIECLNNEDYEGFKEARAELYYFRSAYFMLPMMKGFKSVGEFSRIYDVTKNTLNKMAQSLGYDDIFDYFKNKGWEKEGLTK